MEENNVEVLKCSARVPYNNEVMVAARKKQKKGAAILTLICAAIFVALAVMCGMGNNPSIAAIGIFAGFAALCVATSLYFLLTTKPNVKNDSKAIVFNFYNEFLEIIETNETTQKAKNLTKCLYRSYKNKQYVSKIIETGAMLEFKIFTGTYNGIPQYKVFFLPKNVLGAQTEEVKTFLKQWVGNDYKVK